MFVELDETSNEELKEQVAAMAAENAELRAALATRDSRIAELEARLSDGPSLLRGIGTTSVAVSTKPPGTVKSVFAMRASS